MRVFESTHPQTNRNARLTAGVMLGVALVGALVVTAVSWVNGGGDFGWPPIRTVGSGEIVAWANSRSSFQLTGAVIRTLTFALSILAASLLSIALLSLLTERLERHRLTAQLRRCLPKPVRRLRDTAAGLGLALTVATSSLTTGAIASTPKSPVMTLTVEDTFVTTSGPLASAGDPTLGQRWPQASADSPAATSPAVEPRLRISGSGSAGSGSERARSPAARRAVLPPIDWPTTSSTSPATQFVVPVPPPSPPTNGPRTIEPFDVPQTAIPRSPANSTASVPETRPTTHLVVPGESFWSIAETVIWQHQPDASEHTISGYWHDLIDANQHRLPTSNPDLLFPGILLDLPSPAVPRSQSRNQS